MTLLALALVLTSALLHAVWNLFAKRVSGGLPFVWLFSTVATIIYTPVLILSIVHDPPRLGGMQLLFLTGTWVFHGAYYLLLNRGYRVGDLSLVYPLARGTGPMLSTLGAVVLLSERPTPLAIAGTILIAVGVFVLTGDPRKLRAAGTRGAVTYGLLTGLIIAVYTLWDKQAVSALLITPLMLDWVSGLGRMITLVPFAMRNWGEVRSAWRNHRLETFGIAILDPLGYIIFLTALSFSPVSYLAPMRQVSILIGAIFGAKLLEEGQAPRRFAAVSAMVVGLVVLALG
jgi:drug/metabolite transporter (DMT)-like permease